MDLPRRIHLVGIGGTGLSAIARVLLQRGCVVSGSDRAASPMLDALADEGARVFVGHDPAQIAGAEALIVTSAVDETNPEIAAARAAGIPVYKRADIIAAIMAGQTGVGIAGTHGKTTTTGMLAHILMMTGRDPSFIVGSTVGSLGTNARWGQGGIFVIEADEYDYMFLGLRPRIAVVNNVEWDHPDCFATPEQFAEAFDRFAATLPADGLLIAGADDPGAAALARRTRAGGKQVLMFGQSAPADARIVDLALEAGGVRFTLDLRGQTAPVTLDLPGAHNALNAAAALTAAVSLGLPLAEGAAALTSFQGTGRRFDVRFDDGAVAIIDDYAHHPTAIRATLAAARARFPDRALWAVWQPHTYTRTRALLNDYARAFDAADAVIVTEIYAAREQPIDGITGQTTAAAIQHAAVHFAPTLADAAAILRAHVRAPAAIAILSAGDAPAIGRLFLEGRGA